MSQFEADYPLIGGGGGGGVTSLIAGTGISVNPPGGSGNVTVNNTGIVSMAGGTGITVAGTNPCTVSTTAVLSVGAGNGITISGTAQNPTVTNNISAGTGVSITGTNPLSIANTGVISVTAGTNVTLTGTAANPIINASAASGSVTLISTQTPNAAASVTFSAIPATYKHLLIVGRLEPGTGGISLNLTINGDSTANYAWSNFATASTTGVSASLIQISSTMGGTGGGCEFSMFIPEYATARTSAGIRGDFISHNSAVTGAPNISFFGGHWIGGAAINTIAIAPASSTITGTVSLYGFG